MSCLRWPSKLAIANVACPGLPTMSTGETDKPRDALATLRIQRRDEPSRPSWFARLLKWVVLLTILLLLVWGTYFVGQRNGLFGDMADFVPDSIRAVPEVRLATVSVERGRAGDALVVATGYLESRRQAQIGARAAGRIELVNVEEGSQVKSGQVMAVLEHRDMDAALAATQAELARIKAQLDEQVIEVARSKSDYDRATRLYKSRSISEEEYELAKFGFQGAVARGASIKAAVQLAEARVREAEQLTENMIIRAPFDGTVISKNAEVGESILPGGMGEASGRGSVVTIADLEHLEVDCDVKEEYISRVTAGGPTEIAVDAVPDRRYRGIVRKVIPMGDRARATIKVKVAITDGDELLFPDMSSTVYFLPPPSTEDDGADQNQKRIFVDSRAMQTMNDESFVWLLNEQNRAERITVTVAGERDGRMEITSGLTGGERVILDPPSEIADGTLLRESQ